MSLRHIKNNNNLVPLYSPSEFKGDIGQHNSPVAVMLIEVNAESSAHFWLPLHGFSTRMRWLVPPHQVERETTIRETFMVYPVDNAISV